MVRLDYGFTIGREVTMPTYLSHQVSGTYRIVECKAPIGYIPLTRVSDGAKLCVERRCLAYLLGGFVPSAELYTALNADEFLPEYEEWNIATPGKETEAALDFWFVYQWIDIDASEVIDCLHSDLLKGVWCYYMPHPFPWNLE